MKLAQKIYLYLGCIFIVAMTIFGVFSYQRESVELETDTIRDVVVLGRGFAAAVSHVWLTNGEERAMKIIHDVNNGKFHIKVRWVWLDDTSVPRFCPQVDRRVLRNLAVLPFLIAKGCRLNGQDAIFAYFPVRTNSSRPGALELSASLSYLHRQSRINAWRLSLVVFLLLVAVGLLMWHVGQRMVGQRMQKLVRFARQLGQGQLDNRLCLEGDDEIADLCLEMNQMAEQLQDAKQHLLAENEARIATLEQLRHTERLVTLGKLSSGLAHELGTPLNVISGRARLIENGDMEQEEVVENAAIIRQQTERVTRIIRQMLDYARRTSPQRTKVNLRELIEQVVVILQHNARKQAVEIVVSGLIEKAPEIFVDYGQIQQVITNLLMNGLQAMPQGGRLEIRLTVGVYSPPAAGHYQPMSCAVIMVFDNGPGLADEVLERAFEPFYTTKGVGQGTGLGLSIAREIVVEHGGWITAANIEDGTGACFTVYLPLEEGNDEAPRNDS
ncbi:hypothetical protein MNBD_DELTA03-317 [hydrothermal vent metagenome]|uniref:histidine kinase n=1 Tax=hydrothermal vent metagenome TaxID=652676 RepID=A0A3B0V843_9ZZZZ